MGRDISGRDDDTRSVIGIVWSEPDMTPVPVWGAVDSTGEVVENDDLS